LVILIPTPLIDYVQVVTVNRADNGSAVNVKQRDILQEVVRSFQGQHSRSENPAASLYEKPNVTEIAEGGYVKRA
jgi:hypothetical protein